MRVEKALAALGSARENVDRADREVRTLRIHGLDEQLRLKDAALSQRVRNFYAELLRGVAELRKVANEANTIEAGMGRSVAWADRGRGSRWVEAPGNKGILKYAAGVLPDEPAGDLIDLGRVVP